MPEIVMHNGSFFAKDNLYWPLKKSVIVGPHVMALWGEIIFVRVRVPAMYTQGETKREYEIMNHYTWIAHFFNASKNVASPNWKTNKGNKSIQIFQ